MNKCTTADRLKYLMKERRIRQVDILELCRPYAEKYGVRIEKNDISAYVNGKYDPAQRKLKVLALALNVSEPWLMGFPVSMERMETENQPIQMDGLRMQELIQLFPNLPDDVQRQVLDLVRTLSQSHIQDADHPE